MNNYQFSIINCQLKGKIDALNDELKALEEGLTL